MARLPAMEIDTEASHFFAAYLALRIDKAKEVLSLGLGEERCIEKFSHPIYLMSIGEVKGDLNVFVGVFNDDEAVIIDVRTFPFALEKDGAAFLDLGGAQLGRLEMRNDIRVGKRLDIRRF